MNNNVIKLYGRVFLRCGVKAETGLHIGGAAGAISIGGVDNVVVRDPITQQPCIPGSSLKGKMRSLTEKYHGLEQNRRIGRDVYIHTCGNADDYKECAVCHIYGVPGETGFSLPTRLVVRDAFLAEDSVKELEAAKTDLPFTEVKWEAAIDRVTSAATPRQVERVPAGAVFQPAEMVFSLYFPEDVGRFRVLVDGMQLLEDDYLGGLGSRGGGKVIFCNIEVGQKRGGEAGHYPARPDWFNDEKPYTNLAALQDALEETIIPALEGIFSDRGG
jgi:CRISPR-associated protein Csm3